VVKIRFGAFVLDSACRQIRRHGDEIHLSRKAFDVLCMLLRRRPNVVAKAELFGEIWPDTFVTEANLNVVIGEIRKAIGDSAQAPQFVRTAHGVGYAFCGDAVDLDGPAPVAPAERSRAWLVGAHHSFPLPEGEHVIGRDQQCAIRLDDTGVSRRHARLRIGTDAHAVLEDLQSTNGTFVGRRRVKGEIPLNDGDVVVIGDIELEYRAAHDGPPATRRIRRRQGRQGRQGE
jgi:DNA-binding winged helix-turn-helix (wHTH) protein